MNTATRNIIQLGQASKSALKVAVLRAAHQLLDEPTVFKDDFALPILGKELSTAICTDPYQYNDPISRGLRAALIARSRFAEDRLARAVQAGVKQYVILGAGLDTFAHRNIHSGDGLRVYEVDHPSTQSWKKALMLEAGIETPESVTFIEYDFERRTLSEALSAGGFQSNEPAYFSWLGVTVYLAPDAVMDTLRFVASLHKGSAIAFDYKVHDSLMNPLERVVGEYIKRSIEAHGEPWRSEFDPVQLIAEVKEMGYQIIEDVGPIELNAQYFSRRKDALQTGGGFRFMCAEL